MLQYLAKKIRQNSQNMYSPFQLKLFAIEEKNNNKNI
jgi:hypothetical protein